MSKPRLTRQPVKIHRVAVPMTLMFDLAGNAVMADVLRRARAAVESIDEGVTLTGVLPEACSHVRLYPDVPIAVRVEDSE